jgi:non-ribosomal peptide synthase protein (TIGR01720 family)
VPGRGLGYGLLRYLGPEEVASALRAGPRPEVSFNYLGQLDASATAEAPFRLARGDRGPECGPDDPRPHLVSIDGMVLDGCLTLEWTYSAPHHEERTIRALAESHLACLRALIAHCLSAKAAGYTPSDFAEADLDQSELDALLTQVQRA